LSWRLTERDAIATDSAPHSKCNIQPAVTSSGNIVSSVPARESEIVKLADILAGTIVTFNLVFAAVSSVESDDDIGRVQFLGRAEKRYALN